jgi:hypothetical protein
VQISATPSHTPHADASPRTLPCQHRAEQLEKEIVELCGHLNAAEYRFLELIGEFDRGEHWVWYGVANCAQWLNWQCGLGRAAARERVRIARALPALPKISESFSRGEISYSKVREMTRIATPENEDTLLNVALHGTAAHVQRLVRSYQRAERLETASAEGLHRLRHVRYTYDEDGSMILHAKLPPEIGEVVKKAIEAAVEEMYRDGLRGGRKVESSEPAVESRTPMQSAASIESGTIKNESVTVKTESNVPAGRGHSPEPDVPAIYSRRSAAGTSAVEELAGECWSDSLERLRADGLRLVAERFLSCDERPKASSAERYQVVVHIDQTLLSGARQEETSFEHRNPERKSNASPRLERSELENGPSLPIRIARRLCCDASLVGIVENEQGEPLNVGRKTRTIPPALSRALNSRDGGCRFPGCGRTLFTEGHHVVHWANGGETKLSNLVTLCSFHHTLIHDDGFTVRATGDGGFMFFRPDGTRIEESGYKRTREIMANALSAPRAHAGASGRPSLFGLNRGRGLDIDHRTGSSRWLGERMDYGLAVEYLFFCRDRARAEQQTH